MTRGGGGDGDGSGGVGGHGGAAGQRWRGGRRCGQQPFRPASQPVNPSVSQSVVALAARWRHGNMATWRRERLGGSLLFAQREEWRGGADQRGALSTSSPMARRGWAGNGTCGRRRHGGVAASLGSSALRHLGGLQRAASGLEALIRPTAMCWSCKSWRGGGLSSSPPI